MSIGSRIKEARLRRGITQEILAQKIGVTKSAVANYENEVSTPKLEVMYHIFNALACDANYLYQDDMMKMTCKDKATPEEMEHIKKYRDLDDHGRKSVDITLDRESQRVEVIREMQEQLASPAEIVPNPKRYLYNHLRKIACAGTGFYFDDIPTDIIEAPYMHGTDFIIGVNGDSMEPDYYDGELLYIQKVHELTLGDTGIFMYRNEFFVKELGEKGLISKNTDYEEIEGTEEICLIGRVLGKVEGQ